MIFKLAVASGRDLDLYMRIDKGVGHSVFIGVYNDKRKAEQGCGALAMADLHTHLLEEASLESDVEEIPMLRDFIGQTILPDFVPIPEKELNNWVCKSVYLAYANPVHTVWTLKGFKHGRQLSHVDYRGGDLALLEDTNTHMRTMAPIEALRYAYDPADTVEIEKVG